MSGEDLHNKQEIDKYYFAKQKYLACYKKLCPLTNFCPYQLAHAKNGDYFFLFEWEGGEGFFILFSLVPNVFLNKFPKCSQMHSLEVCQVPKLFPKVFPKALQFYPI